MWPKNLSNIGTYIYDVPTNNIGGDIGTIPVFSVFVRHFQIQTDPHWSFTHSKATYLILNKNNKNNTSFVNNLVT